MPGAYDQDQLVAHDRRRFEIGFIGQKGQNGKIQIALPELVRKPRRKMARHFDLDLWVLLAELEDQLRKKIKASALVRADPNSSASERVQLFKSRDRFIPQIQ